MCSQVCQMADMCTSTKMADMCTRMKMIGLCTSVPNG